MRAKPLRKVFWLVVRTLAFTAGCSTSDPIQTSSETEESVIGAAERFRRVERATADCMLSRGFEYEQRSFEDLAPPSDSVVATYLESLALAAEPAGESIVFETEGEYQAYVDALDGTATGPGCRSEANSAMTDLLFDPAEMETSLAKLASTPEWIEAQDAWIECAAEAGYAYRDPSELSTSISEQLAEILGENPTPELTSAQQSAIDELGDTEDVARRALGECEQDLQDTRRAVSAASFVDE